MADNKVRNIAPFINKRFVVTSKWWNYRDDPTNPGHTKLHRGLDIATSSTEPVYSMLDGVVHTNSYDSARGYYIIIKDDNPESQTYGYATLYQHLRERPLLVLGEHVSKGQNIGTEGSSGSSTGLHLHLEMQDLNRFNNNWHVSDVKSDYIDPTLFMGIDNIEDLWWIYDGIIPPEPTIKTKKRFNWVLYAEKLRKKR